MTKFGLHVLGAVLLAAVAPFAGDAAAQDRNRAEGCIRELARSTLEGLDPSDVTLQGSLAETCRRVGATTARGVEAARARFYAGRAYNRAGNFDEAITQLEVAVNVGKDFRSQFAAELRASQLELARAYRAKGRIEAARLLLDDSRVLSPADPAVANERALLTLAELGEAGQDGAFNALKIVFVQDDAQLRASRDASFALSPAEIRRGRSWLFRLGSSLGLAALARGESQRAVDYLGPAALAINVACRSPAPIDCASGIAATEGIGSIPAAAAPTREQLLAVFFQIGIAHLKAAGLRETAELAGLGDMGGLGGVGALNCIGAQLTPDAARHFQDARDAFNTYIERSSASAASSSDARWGLGCTILANLPNLSSPFEQQRQLSQALEQLRGAPNRPVTALTMARAQVLQGQFDSARDSYRRTLDMLGVTPRCPRGETEFPVANRAELPSRILLEMARTRYARQTAGRGDLFERTIDLSSTADAASLREAEPDLRCAIYLDNRNVEARLTLASLYLRLGAEQVGAARLDPPPFAKAGQALELFERPRSGVSEGVAEGNFLMALRLMRTQQDKLINDRAPSTNDYYFRADGARAAYFSAQAFGLSRRPLFQRQACLALIMYGEVGDQNVCAASGQGAERAESLFLEGLYFLRRGQRETEPTRLRSWSRSIQAFNAAANEAQNWQTVAGNHPTQPSAVSLKELILYGQRYVLRCRGLTEGDSEVAAQEVKDYFRLSGIPMQCGGPPS
jgi:tetratricopeptide (TPR) repeat protein